MKKGDTGDFVRMMQMQLIQAGFKVQADGWFGDTTEAAIKSFQRNVGLVEDGIAGAKTLALLKTGKPDARFLSHADLERAAQRLNVAVACVCAVNEIESRGHGFLPADGRPVILFERHVMYERLNKNGLDAEALSKLFPFVVNRTRGGYSGSSAEYMRLAAAKSVDYVSAIESASWGLFQIMGYHWQALGYESAEAFCSAMSANEAQQLDAFVRFIEADPELLKALKSRKWSDFAKRYNGPAYKENLYDVKLARAYDRYAAEETTA
jgi:hypothetical protein